MDNWAEGHPLWNVCRCELEPSELTPNSRWPSCEEMGCLGPPGRGEISGVRYLQQWPPFLLPSDEYRRTPGTE